MGAVLKVEMLDEADIVPEFPTALFYYTFFIKLVFGMSGMELKDVKMVMVQSMEEELHRKTLERPEETPE